MLSEKQRMKLRKDYQIAAMAGSGIPLTDIASVTGMEVAGVKVTLEEKVTTNLNGLGEVYAQFRDEVRPAIRALFLKALHKMDRKLDRRNFDYKDGINLIRELALIACVTPSAYEETTRQKVETRRVDLSNPENVRAMAKALMQEREEKPTLPLQAASRG